MTNLDLPYLNFRIINNIYENNNIIIMKKDVLKDTLMILEILLTINKP